jgi:hypothetical protein
MFNKAVIPVKDYIAAFSVHSLQGSKLFPGKRIDTDFVEVGAQVKRIGKDKVDIGIGYIRI